MRINANVEGVFLGVSKTEYVSKSTNQPGYFYNLAIKQGAEVGNLPCTKEVYEAFMTGSAGVKEYAPFGCLCMYDDRYNRLTVTEIHPLK